MRAPSDWAAAGALASAAAAASGPRPVSPPGVVAATAAAAAAAAAGGGDAATAFLAGAAAFRVALVALWVSHEWAHVATGELLLAVQRRRRGAASRGQATYFSAANACGNAPWRLWAVAMAAPFSRLPVTLQPHVEAPHGIPHSPTVAVAGAAYSVLVAGALTRARGGRFGAAAAAPAIVAAWVVALCAVVTDVLASAARTGLALYRCGNFGVLVAEAWSRCTDVIEIMQSMAEITAGRGGQSAGVVTYLPSSNGGSTGVRVRVRPGRRQNMSDQLMSALRFRLALRGAVRALLPASRPVASAQERCGIFQGHTRFATSSMPRVTETHPHQWTPERPVPVWRVSVASGRAECATEPFGLCVTHNGDFDFLKLFGRDRTHNEVAAWLTRLLHSPPPAHCDSASVAGVVELFRTQGIWAHAWRLAYQTTLASSFEETMIPAAAHGGGAADEVSTSGLHAFRRRYTSRAGLEELAAVSSRVFADFVADRQLPPTKRHEGLAALLAGAENQLVDAIAAALCAPDSASQFGRRLDERAVREAAAAAVSAFLHNDLFEAVKRFLSDARGSFGLVLSCTLDRDRVVVAAFNQPMSVGFAPARNLVVYGSEANALRVPLPGVQRDGSRLPAGDTSITHRLDLDNVDGEVLELAFVLPAVGEASVRAGGDGSMRDDRSAGGAAWRRRTSAAAGGDASPQMRTSVMEDVAEVSDEDDAVEGGVRSPGGVRPCFPFRPYGCHLRLQAFNVRAARLQDVRAFAELGRLVDVRNNPYMELGSGRANTARRGAGLVENDLRDCARVLAGVRSSMEIVGSTNARTTAALLAMLRERALEGPERSARGGRAEIDVLVSGIESSLWVAEQFASDLQNTFPHLRVTAISANKVIGVLGNARGAISATGFSFCRLTTRLDNTICIVMSHSGQTFPSLHATTILQRKCPGRVFVVTGALDTKMAAALGQSVAPSATFTERIFSTAAGWRSAEPASVSALAMHHLCTELLIKLAQGLAADPALSASGVSSWGAGGGPLGLRLSRDDLKGLTRIRDAFVERGVPELTGVDAQGVEVATRGGDAGATHAALVAQGRAWGWNILEAPVVWCAHAAYIVVTVLFGWPLFRSCLQLYFRSVSASLGYHYDFNKPDWVAPDWLSASRWKTAVFYLAGALDAGLYIFMPALLTLALRAVQGRPVMARIKGRRTLVIADVPYVHQLLEIYVSKLFALSYAIASVDVHGANPVDHFVHRFTHRVARGLLLAVGRPDGRLCSQSKCESWVLMGLLQAKCITNLGNGPEVVTVGHNPYCSDLMDAAITLPTQRPKLLCETICDVNEEEPLSRMAALRFAASKDDRGMLGLGASGSGAGEESLGDLLAATEPIGAHLCADQTTTRALEEAHRTAVEMSLSNLDAEANMHASVHGGRSFFAAAASGGSYHGGVHSHHGPTGLRPAASRSSLVSFAGASHHGGATLMGSVHGGGASHHGGSVADEMLLSAPANRSTVLSGMQRSVLDILESQSSLEEFLENRFLSAERYTAFLVMFEAMAARVASFAPLSFQTHRSQSVLRVASTAAPISAADLERTWNEGAYMDDASVHVVPTRPATTRIPMARKDSHGAHMGSRMSLRQALSKQQLMMESMSQQTLGLDSTGHGTYSPGGSARSDGEAAEYARRLSQRAQRQSASEANDAAAAAEVRPLRNSGITGRARSMERGAPPVVEVASGTVSPQLRPSRRSGSSNAEGSLVLLAAGDVTLDLPCEQPEQPAEGGAEHTV